MNLSMLCMLIFSVQILASSSSYAEAKKLNLHAENATVEEVITNDAEKSTSLELQGQQKEIEVSGIVTDAQTDEPLPGVNIVVQGTNIGTTTDMNGEYSIEAPADATLVFSFVGYQEQTIEISGRQEIDVSMEQAVTELEEVVAVGYGTMKKRDVTGSVSSISVEELESNPVSSVEGALQSKVSGTFVRQSSGSLGGDFEISIRGIGTVTGDNSPLYVVDGVPLFSGDLSTINKNDIESIEVLKDASATAIYGARAANGVVLITTESGNPDVTQLSFSTNVGFEKVANLHDMLSTEQQRQLLVEAFENSGISTDVYDDPSLDVWQVDHNWPELITRTALRQDYNLELNGGNGQTTYAFSGTYLAREGVLLNTDLNRYSFRSNLTHDFKDRLKITARISGSHQLKNGSPGERGNFQPTGGALNEAYQTHSYAPYKDEEGNFIGPSSGPPYFGHNTNPVAKRLEETHERNVTRVLGSFKMDFDISEHLQLTGSGGGDIVRTSSLTFYPVFQRGVNKRTEGSLSEGNSKQINANADATLRYSNVFAGKHDFEGMIGGSVQQFQNKWNNINGSGTKNNLLDQLPNQSSFNASGSEATTGLLSEFIRINYIYDERYLLTSTIRRDGSSRFGPGNRYGFFPSASIGWRLSNERFLNKVSTINDLKLRVSYGLTGNQNIGNFQYVTRAGQANYVYGDERAIGHAAINLGNPNLKWESSKQLNMGVDVRLFEGRVDFAADYYDKRSEDLLIQTPIPLTAGVSQNPTVNIGSVKNTGFEISTTTRNLIGKFRWTTNLNFTYNKNEVIDIGTNSIGEPLEMPGRAIGLSNDIINKTLAGRPVGAFYLWDFDGIWQLEEEEEAAKYGSVPGDVRYVDHNENGKYDEGDKIFGGTPHPKYFGGMTNTFRYKGLMLSASFNYAGGHKLFNGRRNMSARAVPWPQNLAEVADFWTPENPSNRVPRPSQGGTAGHTQTLSTMSSTRFLEDASFIKLNNVTLAYDLPEKVLQSLNVGLTRARIRFTGRNLATITSYSGSDPEANTFGSLLSSGQDMTPYPYSRIFTLGVDITF